MSVNGILNVNKPKGRTSFSLVAWLRKLSGERRVGHAGTLDPIATGVLPVCFGKSTKVVPFLMSLPKTYCAELRLGVTTDTYDDDGRVLSTAESGNVTRKQLESALAYFQGAIQQAAPAFSAVRYQGRYSYELARAGIQMEPRVRQVIVHAIRLSAWNPPFATIEVTCSKGTYVRSLVHELGQRLGCGASMSGLIRSSYGPFDVDQALSVEQITVATREKALAELLVGDEVVFGALPAVTLEDQPSIEVLKAGLPSEALEVPAASCYCRVLSPDGELRAILRYESSERRWMSVRTFSVNAA